MLPKRSKVNLVTRPESQITSTPGGQQSFSERYFMGAKDCRPSGVEVIGISGRVAKLTFDRLGNADFEQSLSIA